MPTNLELECSDQPLCLDFHPSLPHIVAAGLVDGTAELHDLRELQKDDDPDDLETIVSSTSVFEGTLENGEKAKLASCRTLQFSSDGNQLYCGGGRGDILSLDAKVVSTFSTDAANPVKWKLPSDSPTVHASASVQIIREFSVPSQSEGMLVTADDTGAVKLWDARLLGLKEEKNRMAQYYKVHDDYISDIKQRDNFLLATSADGSLSVYDIRMAMQQQQQQQQIQRDKVVSQSDNQEDELLSIEILKNGRKVVCGTGQGVLAVWSWGTWGDVSDRFPDCHPAGSIEAMIKWDEDTLLTGSLDGLLRVVQVQPDKLLGYLRWETGAEDQSSALPIEHLSLNSDRTFVGSLSHDLKLRLFDARILHEDYEEEEDEAVKYNQQPESKAVSSAKAEKAGSDEDWEDMDEKSNEDSNDSDTNSDESSSEEEKTNDKRSKRLKTDNEVFFADL